jgi:putative intracellular protease/amidase
VTAIVTPVGVQLLDQAAIWRAYDRAGGLVDVALDDMTRGQCAAVLAYLRADPARVLNLAMADLARLQLADAVTDAEFIDRAAVLIAGAHDPRRWLEARPLVRRLAERSPRRRWVERYRWFRMPRYDALTR